MAIDLSTLNQAWPLPSQPRPIVIIGAGDIVRDAHLPAYRKAGLPVAGIFDLKRTVAEQRATEFNLARVFNSLEEASAVPGAVFDVATPPKSHLAVLAQLPDRAVVMMQKPMGNSLSAAREIRDLCRRKQLFASVNFQLRFSAYMLAIRDLLRRGELGPVVDVEVRLNVDTPWDLFPFLLGEQRVEIQVHTVHYLDLIRLFLGNPRGAYARTVKHPRYPKFANTKSSIILDYGDETRCCLSINHCHGFGARHLDASVRIEGMDGCAVATLGLLLDYPRGRPEKLDVFARSAGEWREVPLQGSWFPDAFIGTMSNLQRFAAGEDPALVSSVEDAYQTMALVEACYASDAAGGESLEKYL